MELSPAEYHQYFSECCSALCRVARDSYDFLIITIIIAGCSVVAIKYSVPEGKREKI